MRPQYQRECDAQKPYPACPARSERLTVSRDIPQGTGVASAIHMSSNHDGHAAPRVRIAWHSRR